MLPRLSSPRHRSTSRVRHQTHTRRRRWLWVLEGLEHRILLSGPTVYTVTDTSDSAADPGSLRAVLTAVNADPIRNGPDQIVFASDLPAPRISLLSPLPPLTRNQVTITGPNDTGTLDGSSAGAADGLDISGSSDSIQALVIQNFKNGTGISISGTGTSITESSVIGNGTGISVSGDFTTITDSEITANAADGIDITGGGNTVGAVSPLGIGLNYHGGNWISGNGGAGIEINGTGATGNRVEGNLIGTDPSGTSAYGNGTWGILINGGQSNTIGGSTRGAGNVISANIQGGLAISDGASINDVQGNFIGTDIGGFTSFGNNFPGYFGPLGNPVGISIIDSSSNLIGTTGQDGANDALEGNVIGGNSGDGIDISGANAEDNVVTGNLIGLNVINGTTTIVGLGNGGAGVSISDGAVSNLIGVGFTGLGWPEDADQRNIISDNGDTGVEISTGAFDNVVAGNLIGTDGSGTKPLGNKSADVLVENAPYNVIGSYGTDPSGVEQNVIAGSPGAGVEVSGSGATGNLVTGSLIGLNVDSSGNPITGLGNGDGVLIDSGAWGNTIGVSSILTAEDPAKRNVISGNWEYGVEIIQSSTSHNVVDGNLIGIDPGGTTAMGNGTGIWIGGASNNLVGTSGQDGADDALERNIIAGNAGDGIDIWAAFGSSATGNVVAGNLIGMSVNSAGQPYFAGLGNGGNGILISDASSNWVGVNPVYRSENSDQRNVISGNRSGAGVELEASNNVVAGNYIGTDPSGSGAESNSIGVLLERATSNRIGTSGQDGANDAIEDNVISGNLQDAVDILNGSAGNVLAGNLIGLDANGGGDGNGLAASQGFEVGVGSGVVLEESYGNWIGVNPVYGAESIDQRNVISANLNNGVTLQAASDNVVAGNLIGTDSTGTKPLANEIGISILGGSSSNRIGTSGQDGASDAIEGNIIAANNVGVEISGSGTTSNVLAGNWVGLNVDGNGKTLTELGNNLGIFVDQAASGNWIGVNSIYGPENADQRNVISGSDIAGIDLVGSGTSDNVVAGNWIGTDPNGTSPVPNEDGVILESSASNNLIGTSGQPGAKGALERNVISGNSGNGIELDAPNNIVAGNLIGTDAAGTAPLANGVGILCTAAANRIGTTGHGGADDVLERNVIAGNQEYEVEITGTGATNNVVAGNWIGFNVNANGNPITGMGSPYEQGILIQFGASDNWIGVNTVYGPENADQGNVISDNYYGVEIYARASQNIVAGNLIGTDPSGTHSLGNYFGVFLYNASANRIGTTGQDGAADALEQNIIAANEFDVYLDEAGTAGNVVAGNYIGSNAAEEPGLGGLFGINIDFGAQSNWIGVNSVYGPENPDEGNIILGATQGGIGIIRAATKNSVAGNFIGVGPDRQPLGNGWGVAIGFGAQDNSVGGTTADAGNTIANNAGPGVWIIDSGTTGNRVFGNSIYSNGALGIELGGDYDLNTLQPVPGPDGVTLNDSEGHDGPNAFQDFPVLTSAITSGGYTTISGSLPNTGPAPFTIDFYANSTPDPSGYGQGQVFLGEATTDANGNFTGTFATTAPYFSATATDPNGNTSEFCLDIQPASDIATTTTISSGSSASVSGQELTFTATVAGTPPVGLVPSGRVTFTAVDPVSGDSVNLGTVPTDETGTAALTTENLTSVGTYSITATYSGGGSFAGSSASRSQAMNPVTTANVQTVIGSISQGGTLTIQGASSWALNTLLQAVSGVSTSGSLTLAIDLGTGTTLDATSPIVVPAGLTLGLIGTGGATLNGTTVSSGTIIVGSSVSPTNWIVNGGSVVVEGSAAAGDFIVNGGTVTLADGKVITGNSPAVTLNGGTVILQGVTAQTATNAPTILVNGGSLIVRNSTVEESTGYAQAAILITGRSVDLGTTASPGGNIFNVNGTGQFVQDTTSSPVPDIGNTLEVDGAPLSAPYLSLTALRSSTTSAVLGQPVTFTASVRAVNPTDGAPTGTVTFYDGSTILGTAVLSSSQATFATNALPLGANAISVIYGGDANFATSTSSALNQAVIPQDGTTTTLTSLANPSVYGQTVSFTATVTGNTPIGGAPTGTVTFEDGTTTLGTGTLNASDVATYTTTAFQLSVGSDQSITAVYGGDPNFLSSTSSALSQTVNLANTTTTGSSSASSSNFGQTLTFAATVTAKAPGSGTPTGSATFYDGPVNAADQIGTGTLSTSTQGVTTAAFSTPSLPVGTDTITATYGGDADFLTSIGTLTVTINPSIIVLDSTAAGALTLSGNAGIALAKVSGSVFVDSGSTSAISGSGNASITASSIQVVGKVQKSGNATFSPAPTTGVALLPDALATLPSPSTTGLTNHGSESINGNSKATISPGIYSQITVSGNASLILNPGIYIIKGGGFTVTGNASVALATGSSVQPDRVTGTGILIYNAGSNYPNSGGNFGGITLSGNGSFNMAAPTAGPYAGVLIFQSRQNTRALSFSGNAMLGMTGTIYAPSALLSMSGNSQLQNPLVVGMLNLSGNVGLTQTAAGSDGTGDTSGIANTLLAGNLSVYINDPDGLFTPDEFARIQDAINAWDAILAPYNVTITEVSGPSLANIVIDTGTTSACGGVANGVLGCYNEPNNEITLVQGWNWYAGADPSQIGAAQYDFQTTVTHELGHALGLGGSTDPTSPMFETLAAGVADRTVTTQDLNIPDPPEGADPQSAAGFHYVSIAPALSPNGYAAALSSGPNAGPAGRMPLLAAGVTSIGQWSVVSGQWPAARSQSNSQADSELSLVPQTTDRENERGLTPRLAPASTDDIRELDLLEQPVFEHSVVCQRASLVRDFVLDELAADSVGWREEIAARTTCVPALPVVVVSHNPVPIDLMRQQDRPRTPGGFTARLAVILLAAGYCGYGAIGSTRRNRWAGSLHQARRPDRERAGVDRRRRAQTGSA